MNYESNYTVFYRFLNDLSSPGYIKKVMNVNFGWNYFVQNLKVSLFNLILILM